MAECAHASAVCARAGSAGPAWHGFKAVCGLPAHRCLHRGASCECWLGLGAGAVQELHLHALTALPLLQELRGLFAPFGTVEDVHVLPPKGERGQGCAFIKFVMAEEATAAIAGLHDKRVQYPSFPEFTTPMLVRMSHGGQKRQRPW